MLSGAVEASAASLSGAFVATSGSAMIVDSVLGVYSKGCWRELPVQGQLPICLAQLRMGLIGKDKSSTRSNPSFPSSLSCRFTAESLPPPFSEPLYTPRMSFPSTRSQKSASKSTEHFDSATTFIGHNIQTHKMADAARAQITRGALK